MMTSVEDVNFYIYGIFKKIFTMYISNNTNPLSKKIFFKNEKKAFCIWIIIFDTNWLHEYSICFCVVKYELGPLL